MSVREEALVFECGAETLVGVVARAPVRARVGVVVVVGGPQYRAGSHRQFVLLSRFLAERGVPVLRFDCRGMGDSTGDARDFRAIGADIRAAIDAFLAHVHGLERVVLWGLCDGASAACFHAPDDPRVAGVVLINPWVRTEAGEAETYLRHYYAKRFVDPAFWKKLLRGGVGLRASLRSLLSMVSRAAAGGGRRAGGSEPAHDLPDRMSHSLARCDCSIAVILSGRDYVAREFEQVAHARAGWRDLLRSARAEVMVFEAADHTFSSRERRDALALATWDWLVRAGLASEAGDAPQLMEGHA